MWLGEQGAQAIENEASSLLSKKAFSAASKSVNLKTTNPKTDAEEPLTNESVRKLMTFELATLSREKEAAAQRVARRAAAGVNVGDDEKSDDDVNRSGLSAATASASDSLDLLTSSSLFLSSPTLTPAAALLATRCAAASFSLDRRSVTRSARLRLIETRKSQTYKRQVMP